MISIIIPVYNVEKYILKCINSVIEQSYKELEIILVDDGSTDNSGKVCDEISQNDTRIKVIHKKNGGLSDARNAGIKVATGEYIGFVDSDDYIDTRMYELLLYNIKKSNSDIVVCDNFVEKDACPNVDLVNYNNYETITYNSKKSLELLVDQGNFESYSWNKLYMASLFEDIYFPVNKLYEDVYTTYKLFEKAKIITYIKIPLYHYILRNGSITQCSFKYKKLDIINAWDYIAEHYTENKLLYDLANVRKSEAAISLLIEISNSNLNDFKLINSLISEIKNSFTKILSNSIKNKKHIKYLVWAIFIIILNEKFPKLLKKIRK